MQWDAAALVAIITGLVQVFKSVGVPVRFSPLIALACGILLGVFYFPEGDLASGILQGVVVGLASIGFYSGPKNIAKTVKTYTANRKK